MLQPRQLVAQYLAHGLDAGEACLVVTTDQDVRSVADSITDRASTDEVDRLGIVDATGQEPDPEAFPSLLESVGSPADLTGIGIALTKLVEPLAASEPSGYRLVIDSVSSLLVYTGFERVYRFLHAVTNRMDAVDGTSISLLSTGTDRAQAKRFEPLRRRPRGSRGRRRPRVSHS
jgi:KaiC/GvpD/RAD55 family RecA-like ATPase